MTRVLPVQVRAFAKINLTLRVLGRRPDGYHELRTVFQTLTLHDLLLFEATTGTLRIRCDHSECPTDRRNLVWKAAELLWRVGGRRGVPRGLQVTIRKCIPMQAGLGGGSSDAAAALRALAPLWAPRLGADDLSRLAASLGADVPFFLLGGTALGLERGDRLFPLLPFTRSWVVLAQPDCRVSTADAYRWLDAEPVRRRRTSGGLYGEGRNDLEGPVAARYPAITRVVRALKDAGACGAAMSGSGSVCFGLFPSRRAAVDAARALRGPRCATLVTRTQTADEYAEGAAPVATRR
ncbi:MAG: 4-(cytidine 5'-diphospho)-2-C-methyl-D-erythritol kinase [Vicinamibacterales bacterium]